MFKKKFSRPPTSPLRSSQLSDLTFVCQDGVAHAHQFVLEKHSPFLKKFFNSQSSLVGVALNQPIVKGLPATLKERREPSPMVQINLPDYTVLTVNLLLDLLYIGKTDQCGDIDNNKGQLSIRLLYVDLGLDPECGGLPDIAELDTIEIERIREVVVVQQIAVEEEIKEVPSIEVATSTTVDLEAGVNDIEDEVKVIVNPSNDARVNEIPVNHPIEKVEEIVELELNEKDNIDDDSELLGVDVDDLLSEDEVELDFDYETYEDGDGAGLMDTSLSPVVEDSQCLKEFSKIKLGCKISEDEPIEQKEKAFIDEVNKESSEIELDTSFEFDKVVDDGKKQAVVVDEVRTRRPSLKIRLQKHSENSNVEALEDNSTRKDKMELKLSVLGEKRRKRKCSDEDYTPKMKSRKELETKKKIGNTVTRSRSRDVDENGHIVEALQNNKINNLTSATDDEQAHINLREITSSDEVKSSESISDCFRKLCDEKHDEVEFSYPSVSPEVLDLTTGTEASPQLSSAKRNSASTKLPSSKLIRKPTAPSNIKKKETKIVKSKPVGKKLPDIVPEFSCPIQGCPHKHTHFNEKIHPKTYRILKHFISHHLRKEPCGIYRDIESEPSTNKKLFCSNCSYASESRTSLLTHMAWEHGDLYNRIKIYRRKASSKEEVNIYHSVGEYLQGVWEGWRSSPTISVSPTECSVNLTVKDCRPCDEIFPSWYELRTHILAQHCLGVLDLYISGSEEAGYECEASGHCCVKVKDKISILNHLASKEHSIISDKEIVDIALGVKGETNDSKHNVTRQDNSLPDTVVDITTEVEKDNADGSKAKEGYQASVAEKQTNKRKSRDESFEIFGSPLQIIKDPPTSKKQDTSLKKPSKPVSTKENKTLQKTSAHLKLIDNEEVKNYQCKFCVHQYVGDDDLRKHLLEKHTDRFKAVPLLEAGEKAFECVYCNKRTKMKTFHMRHLKKDHTIITLDLIKSEEDWKQGVIGFIDFCMEREESLDCMLQPTAWESNLETVERSSRPRVKIHSRSDKSPVRSPDAKNYVPVPDTSDGDHVLETISDDSFDSLDCILADVSKEDIPEEILPKAAITLVNDDTNGVKVVETDVKVEPVFLQTSSPNVDLNDDSSDDDVIEEFVSITKRKPPKVKHRSRTTTEFVCKVCDMPFPSGAKVSAHVFMFHLQRMSDMVWNELFIQLENSTKVCLLCGDAQERARLAKLHQYSQHKRELKKKMEEKGQDWRNLLDYIQFKVSEEMINEEDVTESEVESKTSSRSEVYNNPYYLANNQPEVINPILDVPPINPSPINPAPAEFPQCSRDQTTLSVVSKTISANKCGDESESDDGVEVCMESRDVAAKKSEVAVVLPKQIKTPEEMKADELRPTPEANDVELKLICPFPKCNELFVNISILVDHYIESHPQSSLKLSLIRALAPDRFCLNTSNRPTIILLGEVREVFSCPQCEVQFVELQLQARHVARHSDSSAAQCDHCRNFVKVGEKEQHQSVCLHRGELERIQDMQSTQKQSESKLPTTAASTEVITLKEPSNLQIALKLYPCTHKHGGCNEVFPEKTELHKHARKCKHRPNTSFSCQHAGCTKRYYYKEDYEKHVAKFHSESSEALPSTSTSSTSVICTPTLHTCSECSSAFPSQQGLLDHTKEAHQLLPKVPCQIKE